MIVRYKKSLILTLPQKFVALESKTRFKSAGPARQEQARLEVENAEDDLVQKTEVAITLMKTVLENVGISPFLTPLICGVVLCDGRLMCMCMLYFCLF